MLKNILKKVRHLEFFANNKVDSLFSGNYASAFKGRGIEFADIRPYDPGDDVRDIDWKTTSKQGEVFVKTYHESRDNTLFFVIDGGMNMQFSSREQKKYERLLEAFMLLSFSAIKNNDRVGILFYDNKNIKIFPPKKGRRNVLKILKFCIESYSAPQKEFSPKTDMSKIFRKVFSFIKSSSAIFWLTGECDELSEMTQKNIKMLRVKNDFIPIVFTDPLEEDFSKEGEYSFQDIYTGKISSMIITPEIIENFKKIRVIKKKKFQHFFQKNRSQSLCLGASDNMFKAFHVFFQKRQKSFI